MNAGSMLSAERRPELMALIRGKGNKSTELRLVALLRAAGISGWRRHLALPGRPDFTFPKQRLCIFVHGCFWHGCPHCYKTPRTNTKFWQHKVATNRSRDRRAVRNLRARGYRTITIWECGLRGTRIQTALARITRALSR